MLFLSLLPGKARGVFVPGPAMEHVPPAVDAQTANHWTIGEAPSVVGFTATRLYLKGEQINERIQ